MPLAAQAAVVAAGFLLREVEHRLDAAAEVHEAEDNVVNVAAEHVGGEVLLEGEQRDRREVVEDYDGQDDEDHLEGSLLHRVHLVSAGSGLPQRAQYGDVAEHHEGERRQDHRREDLLEVGDVAHAFGGGVSQRDHPDDGGQDGPVLAVLELGEGDGMDHGHVAVQADAGEEERRGVFNAVEEAQDIPGAAGGEEDNVCQLQRGDEAEEHVQNRQVKDEDIRGGGVALVFVDEPKHHNVGRDAQEHVEELEAQVPNDNRGHVSATLVHRLHRKGVVEGPVGDEERRGVCVESLHGAQITGVNRKVTSVRGSGQRVTGEDPSGGADETVRWLMCRKRSNQDHCSRENSQ